MGTPSASSLDIGPLSWALEPTPQLSEGPVTDGPVELWIVLIDSNRVPLALGRVSLADLAPTAKDGRLTLVGSARLRVVRAGRPWAALVVMVNQDDRTYRPVFPLELVGVTDLKLGDTVSLSRWEWSIHQP